MSANVLQHIYFLPRLILVPVLTHNHILTKLQANAFRAQILQIQPLRPMLLVDPAFVILIIHGTQLKAKLHAFAQITPLL
jgi:hypothetical protein